MWPPKCIQEVIDLFSSKKYKDQVQYLEKHLTQAREQIKQLEGPDPETMKCGHPVACMESDQCGMKEHDFCGWCEMQQDCDMYETRCEEQQKELTKLRLIVKKYISEHPEEGLEI